MVNRSWKIHIDRVGHRGNGPVDVHQRVMTLHRNSEEARLNFNGAGLAQRTASVEGVVACQSYTLLKKHYHRL